MTFITRTLGGRLDAQRYPGVSRTSHVEPGMNWLGKT